MLNRSCFYPLFVWCLAWFPVMLSASYAWKYGEYYDYGWIVPVAALLLVMRRWNAFESVVPAEERSWLYIFFLLLPLFFVLRVFYYVDPSWRLPVGILALVSTFFGHWIFQRVGGLAFSLSFWKISLLMLSAIPWPNVLEKKLVHWLTDHVIQVSAEIFRLCGKPVEVLGDRMSLDGMVVEVTNGCSGVRSFQSFFMATWFFAELQNLKLDSTLKLLAWALVGAFVVNTGRASALAYIRFNRGQEAADAAHDMAGLVAFFLSAVFFYWLSVRLDRSSKRRVIRKKAIISPTP